MAAEVTSIPILDLSWADDSHKQPELLDDLRAALFDVGFLYIINHGVASATISGLTDLLPQLFAMTDQHKAALSKLNSPHFLGYSGFAGETTLGKQDLREQFDFATELPVVYAPAHDLPPQDADNSQRDFSKLYWRLRGPNQWPAEELIPGFRKSFTEYQDAIQRLSYRFVHLIEEAVGIPIGTFDHFFDPETLLDGTAKRAYLPPQHRIKLSEQ